MEKLSSERPEKSEEKRPWRKGLGGNHQHKEPRRSCGMSNIVMNLTGCLLKDEVSEASVAAASLPLLNKGKRVIGGTENAEQV